MNESLFLMKLVVFTLTFTLYSIPFLFFFPASLKANSWITAVSFLVAPIAFYFLFMIIFDLLAKKTWTIGIFIKLLLILSVFVFSLVRISKFVFLLRDI
ncbi:MAG: hypothetical protein MRERV_63c008 [Mycoplasmataceae bacterium RV_VA103A]|nr:MAG: hypothetical protein MRERV_63c008 [Mycoplasmataceae bacterium RV_VA103A]